MALSGAFIKLISVKKEVAMKWFWQASPRWCSLISTESFGYFDHMVKDDGTDGVNVKDHYKPNNYIIVQH